MNLTHAMILAAGLGTRMRPLTETMPKPMIPVMGKPLIDWCLDFVAGGGISQVVINSSYLPEQLEAHLSPRTQVQISREVFPPLETGGGIKKALPLLGEGPFVAMNSDAIFPPAMPHPIGALKDAWSDALDFMLLLVPKRHARGWAGPGDFIRRADGAIRRPNPGEDAPYVFTGVEMIHPRAFADAPDGAFSLSALWKRNASPEGWFDRVGSVVHTGDWLNVGDLPGLDAANRYFE
ncbi:MAG: nucleotidyltransferase family protein [Rickettsiales bacterium]